MEESKFVPRWIAWEITGKCNLHCIHCRSSSDMESDEGIFDLPKARALMDELADFAAPVVVLSGGEPLLRPDWDEIARYGTAKGLRMCLATNGTLVDAQVCLRIRESGIRMVSLSLDGSTAGIHDAFRRQPGAFEGVRRAVDHFRRYGIPFLINSSFTRRNQHDIQNVYRLAREWGAKAWYLFMIVPTGRAGEALEELITKEDYEKILAWHYELEKDETDLLLRPTCAPHYFRIVRERALAEGRAWKPRSLQFSTGVSKGCLAGQYIAFIDRKGEVRPCSYFEGSAGNVRERPFREIWQTSALFEALRAFPRYEGKCGACEYLQVCGGCRARAAAFARGNYLAEEPFCTYVPLRMRKADLREDSGRSPSGS